MESLSCGILNIPNEEIISILLYGDERLPFKSNKIIKIVLLLCRKVSLPITRYFCLDLAQRVGRYRDLEQNISKSAELCVLCHCVLVCLLDFYAI